ncbi:unnamed protein product [Acanthoscelides obtectus]|uniref:Uncharacterized protein n=1 Tax=Acanthoscelides obtectus TaxID=200917 RepID=A0A9P0Q425_ACAOB|nr:unnamed protein product [Acanthoscelides obtectus]CAK1688211.1 hypothetical protein AOBTE_LOCUS36612 [Acanthoscelides obtectus]
MLKFRELLVQSLLNDKDEDEEIEDEQDVPIPRKNAKSTHIMKKFEGNARQNRKRFISCYDKLQKEKGTKEARAKNKRVMTYCDEYDNIPAMCLECFNEKHRSK